MILLAATKKRQKGSNFTKNTLLLYIQSFNRFRVMVFQSLRKQEFFPKKCSFTSNKRLSFHLQLSLFLLTPFDLQTILFCQCQSFWRFLHQSFSLLICTLISENQGLEKSRSVSNLRKNSGPANLDFFLGLHLEKKG